MEGTYRSTRDPPPSHLTFRIESFSTLSSSSLERYESCEFEAGDHTWKLALYPNGNKSRGVKNHLSLYLVLINADDLEKEIYVNFGFLLFDHQRRKYLSVQSLACFDQVKLESGFDEFLSHKIFMDPSSGYLEDDTCVFGAEVFCVKNEPKGHCLSMSTTKPAPFKYTWKIENFSKLENDNYRSEIFTTRGHDWNLSLYPKGYDEGKGKCVSLYLHLADSETLLPDGKDVLLEFKLRIVNQVGSEHQEAGAGLTVFLNSLVNDWGWSKFLNLSDLSGYLVNDTCVVEVELIVLDHQSSKIM